MPRFEKLDIDLDIAAGRGPSGPCVRVQRVVTRLETKAADSTKTVPLRIGVHHLVESIPTVFPRIFN